MNRAYVTCHILSALDGKIVGSFMNTESNRIVLKEYARIRKEMDGDAWLYGMNTTKEFVGFRKPIYTDETVEYTSDDYVAPHDLDLYYVSIDVDGEIGWESGTFQMSGRGDFHVIEVITESTPHLYRSYLRKHGVSYITAGEKSLDCKVAVKKLAELFGIKNIIICGGGVVNWSFLREEVVDELSLVLSPVADGDSESVTVFEKLSSLQDTKPVEFELKDIERINGDGLHITYKVKK